MAERGFEFAVMDVFGERALEGNPLAVFHDARGMTDAEMQALARETNLAETTFILPTGDKSAEIRDGVRVRIFTTQEELPFAGHPTLGTAAWLYFNHPALKGAEEITLKENSGPITVRFGAAEAGEAGVFGTMRQQDPCFGALHDRGEVARVLNVAIDDLDDRWPVQTVSTGMGFCIVMMRSMEAIGRLAIPQAAAKAYLDASDAKFFFCMARAEAASGADFHNRMQFYSGEDPATGSASGCAISYLVKHGIVASGHDVVFEQGVEIRRPSRIYVNASVEGETVTKVFVGGRTIPVATGQYLLA